MRTRTRNVAMTGSAYVGLDRAHERLGIAPVGLSEDKLILTDWNRYALIVIASKGTANNLI